MKREIITSRSELIKNYFTSILIFLPLLINGIREFSKTDFVVLISFTNIVFCLIFILKLKRSFFLPLIFLSFIYSTYMLVSGTEGVNYLVLGAVLDTNLKEASEFLNNTFVLICLLFNLLLLFLFIFYIIRKKTLKRLNVGIQIKKSTIFFFLVGSISVIPILTLFGKDISMEYPISLYDKLNNYVTAFNKFEVQYKNLKYNFEGTVDSDSANSENYILVIGEACRRQSMSIYGYKRPTTPGLDSIYQNDRDNIVVCPKCISQASCTRYAVPLILSTTSAKNWFTFLTYPTMLDIFKSSGYKLYLASSQIRYGFDDYLTTFIFNNKFERSFWPSDSHRFRYDGDLLPKIFEYLRANAKKKLIIIHLDGSHYKYEGNYPPSFAYFKGHGLVDTYDNSVRYTDHFLKTLSDSILNSSIPSCFLYTSDHGENLNDNNDYDYLHGMKHFTKYEIHVPFIFIFNKSFLEHKPDKVKELRDHSMKNISQANISQTFLGLAGLKDQNYYKSEMDLSSINFKETTRYLIDNNENIVRFQDIDKLFHLSDPVYYIKK